LTSPFWSKTLPARSALGSSGVTLPKKLFSSTAVSEVWASVEPQVNQGKESFTTMDQLQALDISRITVRRQSVHGVTAKMRVKMYDILPLAKA